MDNIIYMKDYLSPSAYSQESGQISLELEFL